MRAEPSDIETAALLDALADGWALEVERADYAPVGGGSYHWVARDRDGTRTFVTVDDLDQKRWLGDTREAAYEALKRAFDTAVALRKVGLAFVAAAILGNHGESLRRIGARHTVALFPFVDGQAGRYGEYDGAARTAVVSMLAELHLATPAVGSVANRVGLELPGRQRLEAGLRELSETWSGGPFSEPARETFAGHASDVAAFLSLADRLAAAAAAAVARRGDEWVVTHGEPHSANVDGEDLADYTEATDHEIDRHALDFFRLTWDLKDLAERLNVLRSPHRESEDTIWAYETLATCVPSREWWSRLLG